MYLLESVVYNLKMWYNLNDLMIWHNFTNPYHNFGKSEDEVDRN